MRNGVRIFLSEFFSTDPMIRNRSTYEQSCGLIMVMSGLSFCSFFCHWLLFIKK